MTDYNYYRIVPQGQRWLATWMGQSLGTFKTRADAMQYIRANFNLDV